MMKLENASMKTWRLAMAGVALALVSPLTLAAAAIQAITSTQQAGAEVVRIDLSEPLATLPAGFVVQAPPRIAIDLPGVTNALPRNVVDINNGNLRTVNVANAGDRSRVVLNLRQATTYRAELQGKSLLLILDPAVGAAPAPAQAAQSGVASGEPRQWEGFLDALIARTQARRGGMTVAPAMAAPGEAHAIVQRAAARAATDRPVDVGALLTSGLLPLRSLRAGRVYALEELLDHDDSARREQQRAALAAQGIGYARIMRVAGEGAAGEAGRRTPARAEEA